MAKTNLKEQEALRQEKVEATVSKTEQFFNENKKWIYGILAAILLIGLCVLAYNQWILKPKMAEAQEQMYHAEDAFANGEYELALVGDGNNLGFSDIMKEYGSKAGKAIYLYTGVCNLQLGNFQEALDCLKKYKGTDNILKARAQACMGDAYVGLENYSAAVKCFEKAAETSGNVFSATYLLKAGVAYEEMGQKDKALACYEEIKDQYPQSVEAYDIDKYISRAKAE